jgi:hypothetical protein
MAAVRNDFFELLDEYSDGNFGPPTIKTRLTIAKRTKSVSTKGAREHRFRKIRQD